MIGVGLIGYGYWGPNLARCVAEADGARLLAIHDSSPAARARAARRHPDAAIVDDARDLLTDPAVDAVVIATPVRTHYELALAALHAGKHVLVEKPMAASRQEARHLVDEAARQRRVLMVDHTFVFTPAVRKIRELIASEHLGSIFYYDSTRVNLGLFQKDVNVIWDLAVHDLAILDHIFDEHPVALAAQSACHVAGSPETMAFVTLFFPNGTVAHINVNWLAPVKVRQTLIGGSRRMIVWDDLQPSEKIKVYDKGVTITGQPEELNRLRIGYRTGDMWAPQLETTEALVTEIAHFVDCIDHGRTPITDGVAGLRIVELLETAHWSSRQGGRAIDLQPERMAS